MKDRRVRHVHRDEGASMSRTDGPFRKCGKLLVVDDSQWEERVVRLYVYLRCTRPAFLSSPATKEPNVLAISGKVRMFASVTWAGLSF